MKDIAELLKVSARICGAIAFASIVFLFFPKSLLGDSIIDFREKIGAWVFIVFCVSFSLFLSHPISKAIPLSKNFCLKWKQYKLSKKCEKILAELNEVEKYVVYLLYMKYSDNYHHDMDYIENLTMKNIIMTTSSYSHVGMFSYTLQSWVRNCLHNNKCLLISLKVQEDTQNGLNG